MSLHQNLTITDPPPPLSSFSIFCHSIRKKEVVVVVTCDGRVIVGTLAGHDQVQNLVLSNSHERVYADDVDVERVPTGLYVVRGDTVCLIGDFDEAAFDDQVRVPIPLPAVQQHQF